MSEGWKSWSLREWNASLFEHVFRVNERDGTRPVVRIPVTPEFLATAVGADPSQASEVRSTFVALFKGPPRSFNWLFNPAFVGVGDCRSDDPPPFFAQLVLTLLVASASAETWGEGDFRGRLAIELGHPSDTSYPLRGMPELWRSLRDWLAEHRTYRQLVLPKPSVWDKLIGISKRLAFPSHRDYLALTHALADTGLDAECSPVEIIDAIRECQARFTSAFIEVFDEFVIQYQQRSSEVRDHPFWSAVRSISWESSGGATAGAPSQRYALHLSLSDPTSPRFTLLTNRRWERLARGLRLEEIRPRIGEMAYAVVSDLQADQFVGQLLSGKLPAPQLDRSQLAASIRDGCVCFGEDETGERISLLSPRVGEEAHLVLNDKHLRIVSTAVLRQGVRPALTTDITEGWKLFGPTPTTLLAAIGEKLSDNEKIRCLLPRLPEPTITLRETCRVGDSYLFRPGTYPEVVCTEADQLLARADVDGQPIEIPLAARPSEIPPSVRFRFPNEAFESVAPPRHIELVAVKGSTSVTSRRFHACRAVTATDYKLVPDHSIWLQEGVTGQLDPLDNSGNSGVQIPQKEDGGPNLDLRGVIERTIRHDLLTSDRVALGDLPEKWAGLIEVIAGGSLARQGLAESKLVELITQCVAPDPQWLVWDIARSLVENFQLGCFTARRWSGRRYFAVRPSIVGHGSGGTGWVIGLLPELFRARLAEECRALGIAASFSHRPSTLSVGPVRLEGTSKEILERLGGSLSIPICGIKEFGLSPAPPLSTILDQSGPAWEQNYGNCDESYWDWRSLRFLPNRKAGKVRLSRRLFRDRPDEYEVACEEGRKLAWVTRSRTWALIIAHSLAKTAQFQLSSEGVIRRLPNRQGYLPLPSARALVLSMGSAAGLEATAGGTMEYRYNSASVADVEIVCRSLLISLERRSSPRSIAVERWRAARPGMGATSTAWLAGRGVSPRRV